jgi:predicted TIM-barrel fold metal-dependent hydrolase
MDYKSEAQKRINFKKLVKNPTERLSKKTKELLKKSYVIDVHSHLFDIKCVNKSYFIIRCIKDFLGLKSSGEITMEFSEEDAYKTISSNEENWEKKLFNELEGDPDIEFRDKNRPTRGFIDKANATKFLLFKKMIDVYNHYLINYSLAEIFGIQKSNIISTALTMDLEMGWNVKIKKTLYEQITELKSLSLSKPVLPFLYCDPRRADIGDDNQNNLYSLFNYAFCKGQSFFGIKIYPALGYDPSDYRLWPIYEICQEFSIPVITHCGGETVSTDRLCIEIFEGWDIKTITASNRKEMAYNLNNPKRWEVVLKRFPELRLNFGHFGGYETWDSSSVVDDIDPQHRKECIIGFMEKYPNVYADFAFNFVEEKLAVNLINILIYKEKVRQRTLFGTDYWMVTPEGNLKNEQREFIERLKDSSMDELDLVKSLLIDNPKRFLFD